MVETDQTNMLVFQEIVPRIEVSLRGGEVGLFDEAFNLIDSFACIITTSIALLDMAIARQSKLSSDADCIITDRLRLRRRRFRGLRIGLLRRGSRHLRGSMAKTALGSSRRTSTVAKPAAAAVSRRWVHR